MRKDDILKVLEDQARTKRENRIKSFVPYAKQSEFFALGATIRERLLMAGNQLGKSEAGAFEVACHLTGQYPDWWTGRRWDRSVIGWAGGESSMAVRDIQQRKLCGTPGVEALLGTGMIPRAAFVGKSMGHGASDAFDTIKVRHVSGGVSELSFKSYEQGRTKWQGSTLDFVWFDEEPDEDIYIEGLARTGATKGMTFLTFTPLKGLNQVVPRFLNEASPDRAVVQMGIRDALHFTPVERERIIAGYPAHEREARANGAPLLGSGKVFQTPEDAITVQPFDIPPHWKLIWGLDFGIQHPFAAVLVAWDVESDAYYVVKTIRMKDATPLQHAYAIRPVLNDNGWKIPAAWPQDGHQRKEFEGQLKPMSMIYRRHGVKMLDHHAAFADGSNSTEAGVIEMDELMKSNRFKVFNTETEWFEEYRNYHRDGGQLVKIRDDLMSATRVAMMAKRHARPVLWVPERGGEILIARDVDIDVFADYS